MAVRKQKRVKAEQITISELAKRVGASSKSVTGALERGDIPPECVGVDGHGRRVILDAARAEEGYRAVREARQVPRGGGMGLPGECPAELPEGVELEDPDTWPRDLDGLRIVREWWIARNAKRKDDQAASELVRADDVRREIFGAVRTIRDQVLKIPESVAADIASELGVDDVTAVRNALRESLVRALTDLHAALQGVAASAASDDAAA